MGKVIVLRRSRLKILCILLLCLGLMTCAFSFPNIGDLFSLPGAESDHVDGRTIRVTDEDGKLITMTARDVHIGDEITLPAGDHYRVNKIKGTKAGAKLIGQDSEYLAWAGYFANNDIAVSATAWGDRPVGVYHTHSDESYVPTDGESSIPFRGGIYQVGEEFVKVMRANGMKANYYKTPHDPHDANAYTRSRRTAMGLMKTNPIAIFDIHRDGVPDPEFFEKKVSGEDIAQLRLVIGQQNPKMKTNKDFARRIMAYANEKSPGVIKEIYHAKGNYNQDLLSTSILLEAGTYTNDKSMAQTGIRFLAEALPVVLGVSDLGSGVTGEEASKTGWNVALWLIGITLIAGLLFVFINNGWSETIKKMQQARQGMINGKFLSHLNESKKKFTNSGAWQETWKETWRGARKLVQRATGNIRDRLK